MSSSGSTPAESPGTVRDLMNLCAAVTSRWFTTAARSLCVFRVTCLDEQHSGHACVFRIKRYACVVLGIAISTFSDLFFLAVAKGGR